MEVRAGAVAGVRDGAGALASDGALGPSWYQAHTITRRHHITGLRHIMRPVLTTVISLTTGPLQTMDR